jgi:hypothetical protein
VLDDHLRSVERQTIAARTALDEARKQQVAKDSPQTQAATVLAERTLAVAEAQTSTLRTRAAADQARAQQPPAANAKELAQQAARAERVLVALRAEETLARAELDVLRADDKKRGEVEKQLAAARDAAKKARAAVNAPSETYTPLRGALKTLESNVEPEASRNRAFPATSTGRRSALAHWLTDPRHPLTARVAVNHVWLRHFGKPLVPSLFDFGRKGTPPTHPALLDYLAVEFMENGWSLKHLHRLMVTAHAYRLTSSAAGAASHNLSADAENRWYWRRNPLRMEAEVLRDSLLHLAGELDSTMSGPAVPVSQEASRRRSLYFVHSHNDQQKFLAMFDHANVLECYRRAESIVPQQALALSNSRLALDLAERITTRLTAIPERDFIRTAFEMILASPPTAAEQAACEQALTRVRGLLQQQKQAAPDRQARVMLVQALLNHNDFVTIR